MGGRGGKGRGKGGGKGEEGEEGEHVLYGFCLLAPVFCEERTREMLGKEAMEHSLDFVAKVLLKYNYWNLF